MASSAKTLEYRDGSLFLLDQTRLPLETVVLECTAFGDVAEAIRSLRVRGAPAIGCAAAYGVVLAAQTLEGSGVAGQALRAAVGGPLEELRATRPTAVNLEWALRRMERALQEAPARDEIAHLRREADAILAEDEVANRAMGRHGADLIPDGANVLTHCNAGALATGAFGTAVGVIQTAWESGKEIHVWVDETRPLLQGARLTAWELQQAGIPYTIITDSMAGHFMQRGRVDLVMVGADRVAANGDSANKIGTYGLAVLANAHHIPFYFVAPRSSLDPNTPSGDSIPIEERSPEEVTSFRTVRVAPPGAQSANPAFDVTPASLVSALVTECGVIRPPIAEGVAALSAGRTETTVTG